MKKLLFLLGVFSILLFIGTARATTWYCNSCSTCQWSLDFDMVDGDTLEIITAGFDGSSPFSAWGCIDDPTMLPVPKNDIIIRCDNPNIPIDGSASPVTNFVKIGDSGELWSGIGATANNVIIENCWITEWNFVSFEGNSDNLTVRNSRMRPRSGGVAIGQQFPPPLLPMIATNLKVTNNIIDIVGGDRWVMDYYSINFGVWWNNIINKTSSASYYTSCNPTYSFDNGSIGNFWADDLGTGYSQTCTDSDHNGICDSSYTVCGGTTDFFPLASPSAVTINVTIVSPENISYTTTSIPLNVSANETIDTWWYNLNGGSNTTFTPNITITGIQGSNNIIVYANDSSGNEGSSQVSFFIDSIPPAITIYSPQNITYNNVSQVDLQVSANETIDTWWYSINGGGNTTFTPNTTINIANGSNTLFIYANDTLGNIGQASVSFTANYPCVTFLNSPNDGNITVSSVPINMTFNCSALNDINLANITLYLNGFPDETQNVTGIYNFTIFTKTLSLGNYTWTCRACDYQDQCSFGVPTRILSITAPPTPRAIDIMGFFAPLILLLLGAGVILFLIEGFFTSGLDLKRLVTVVIGAIIVVALMLSLI
jgi:uncharacterized membrane protein YeaQ/YmgE (transglycosylase-associated protein family)